MNNTKPYILDFSNYVDDVRNAVLYVLKRMNIECHEVESELYSIELTQEEREVFKIIFEEYFYSI